MFHRHECYAPVCVWLPQELQQQLEDLQQAVQDSADLNAQAHLLQQRNQDLERWVLVNLLLARTDKGCWGLVG